MKNRKIKKNQHYVPKSHFKRFTIEGEKSLIWAFDKQEGDYQRLTSSINKICAADYYYYQITPNGDVDHTAFEDVLSEVEMIGNNIIDKILASRFMPCVPIQASDKGQLSFYIALLLFRGPAFRNGVNEIYGHMAKFALNQVWDNNEAPEVLKKLVEEKGISNVIDLHVNSTVSLEHIVRSAEHAALEFMKREWIILNAPEGASFVTGDVPVAFYPYQSGCGDIGPAHPLAEILYPISKSSALILTPSSRPHEHIRIGQYSHELLEDMNRKMCESALRFIYTSERLDWLKKMKVCSNVGQRLHSNVGMQGINVVTNPWRNKTNKALKLDA